MIENQNRKIAAPGTNKFFEIEEFKILIDKRHPQLRIVFRTK